jgi:hypothetical protein
MKKLLLIIAILGLASCVSRQSSFSTLPEPEQAYVPSVIVEKEIKPIEIDTAKIRTMPNSEGKIEVKILEHYKK